MSSKNELPPELGRLSTFIDSNIECLGGSSSDLRSVALYAAKYIFDWALETEKSSKPHLGALLATLSQTAPPQTRSRTRNKPARQCSPDLVQNPRKKIDVDETPLPSLFIEGMNIDQIWQQMDLRAARVCRNLELLQGEDGNGDANSDNENDESQNEENDEDGNDVAEMDIDDNENLWEELSSGGDGGSSGEEGIMDLGEGISSEDDEDHESPPLILDIVGDQQKPKSYSQGHSSLDDGFFNLATFNAETSELETKEVSRIKLDLVADEDSAEDSEIGLFGSVDESEIEAPPELFYSDFFEPLGRTQDKSVRSSKVRFHDRVSVKRIKAVGKGMPVSYMGDEDSDEEEDD